ncbi:MAG: hypothetical protein ABIC91_07620 [Nanoarchaeota archaeon]
MIDMTEQNYFITLKEYQLLMLLNHKRDIAIYNQTLHLTIDQIRCACERYDWFAGLHKKGRGSSITLFGREWAKIKKKDFVNAKIIDGEIVYTLTDKGLIARESFNDLTQQHDINKKSLPIINELIKSLESSNKIKIFNNLHFNKEIEYVKITSKKEFDDFSSLFRYFPFYKMKKFPLKINVQIKWDWNLLLKECKRIKKDLQKDKTL